MKGTMKDTEEPVEEDDPVEQDDLEELEPTEADLDEAVVPAEPPEPADPADPAAAEVESIQDMLVKQEARAEEEEAEEEDEAAVALTRDERLGEPLDTRVVPMQTTEFVCKRCFLVKHRSQLADKKRTLCRDCA
jgi:phage protein D